MSTTTQSRHWAFTLNNWTDDHVDHLAHVAGSDDVCYLIFGREVGDSGTPHLQGFVSFSRRLRFSQVRELIPDSHLSRLKTTPFLASEYCKKQDADFLEFGEVVGGQGRRTDLENFMAFLDDQSSIPSIRVLTREFPGIFMLRGPERMLSFARNYMEEKALITGEPLLRGWQDELFQKLEEPAHPRIVDFYVDPVGNTGKTWFSQFLMSRIPGVQYLTVGKVADLCHAIDEANRVFIFDVPRSQMEFFQYQVLEMLKNRLIFSPKYQSVTKRLSTVPHVVVFCNESPDESRLSADRFNIVDL